MRATTRCARFVPARCVLPDIEQREPANRAIRRLPIVPRAGAAPGEWPRVKTGAAEEQQLRQRDKRQRPEEPAK